MHGVSDIAKYATNAARALDNHLALTAMERAGLKRYKRELDMKPEDNEKYFYRTLCAVPVAAILIVLAGIWGGRI